MAGEYMCKATSASGTVATKAQLRVYGKLIPPNLLVLLRKHAVKTIYCLFNRILIMIICFDHG